MRKLLIILAIGLPFIMFGQSGTVIEPKIPATGIEYNVDSLAIKDVDATNISQVVFTLTNNDTIKESFDHVHTEYRLTTTTIIPVAESTYTVANTVDDAILSVSYTATGAVGITLPAVRSGVVLHIKDSGGSATTNNITITPASGTIDGAATLVVNTNYESVSLFTDGTNWFIY